MPFGSQVQPFPQGLLAQAPQQPHQFPQAPLGDVNKGGGDFDIQGILQMLEILKKQGALKAPPVTGAPQNPEALVNSGLLGRYLNSGIGGGF